MGDAKEKAASSIILETEEMTINQTLQSEELQSKIENFMEDFDVSKESEIPSLDSFKCTGNESEDPNFENLIFAFSASQHSGTKKVKGRRHGRQPSEWLDVKRKKLTNLGLEYQRRNGDIKSAKVLGPSCKETCRLNCSKKISNEVRKKLFSMYWNLADHTRQWEFITKLAERVNKKRITVGGHSNRKFTICYYLPLEIPSNTNLEIITHDDVKSNGESEKSDNNNTPSSSKLETNNFINVQHKDEFKILNNISALSTVEPELIIPHVQYDIESDIVNPTVECITESRIVKINTNTHSKDESQLIENSKKVLVCKTMFLQTFDISEKIVYTALDKLHEGSGEISADGRGTHNNHSKVLDDEMIRGVLDHVKKFAPIQFDNVKKQSNKLYLDGDLSFVRMFELYNQWYDESIYSNRAFTLRHYRDIINQHFDLEFYVPKEKCDDCQLYNDPMMNTPCSAPVTEMNLKYRTHLRNNELVKVFINDDKILSSTSLAGILTSVYDFQKTLNAPQGQTSEFFYKQKLSVYNFTIYNVGQKEGHCYMWHEGIARKGANEVSSCVFDFILQNVIDGFKDFRFYSPNSGKQNHNRIIFEMYLFAAKEFNISIIHRFLEKGHSQNEADSIHAVIEKNAKNKTIYTPEQWYALVRWAKEDELPFKVKEMNTENFLDFKNLLKEKCWERNINKEEVCWSDIREIKIDPTAINTIFYKTDFSENDYKAIVVVRSKKTSCPSTYGFPELKQAYKGPLPISEEKLRDLKYLCDNLYIPSQYHCFYESLASGKSKAEEEDTDV